MSAGRSNCTCRSTFVSVPLTSVQVVAGQDDVRQLGRFGQEEIMDDEEVELFERRARPRRDGLVRARPPD